MFGRWVEGLKKWVQRFDAPPASRGRMPDGGGPPGSMPDTGLRFAPELFECRSEAQALLAEADILWLSHYSSVDPLHDLYGLEVCGIRDEQIAERIHELLRERFPAWGPSRCYYKDWGTRDVGWMVQIHREPHSRGSRGWMPQ